MDLVSQPSRPYTDSSSLRAVQNANAVDVAYRPRPHLIVFLALCGRTVSGLVGIQLGVLRTTNTGQTTPGIPYLYRESRPSMSRQGEDECPESRRWTCTSTSSPLQKSERCIEKDADGKKPRTGGLRTLNTKFVVLRVLSHLCKSQKSLETPEHLKCSLKQRLCWQRLRLGSNLTG